MMSQTACDLNAPLPHALGPWAKPDAARIRSMISLPSAGKLARRNSSASVSNQPTSADASAPLLSSWSKSMPIICAINVMFAAGRRDFFGNTNSPEAARHSSYRDFATISEKYARMTIVHQLNHPHNERPAYARVDWTLPGGEGLALIKREAA